MKAATMSTDVAPPPMENNIAGGISCRITPASNMPPIRSFATSSKNFAASCFIRQKYEKFSNYTNSHI